MLTYPPGREQRPTRLSAASLRPEFKQKIGKTRRGDEQRRQGGRCGNAGKCAERNTLGTLAARNENKERKKARLPISSLTTRTDQTLISRMPREKQQHNLNKVL